MICYLLLTRLGFVRQLLLLIGPSVELVLAVLAKLKRNGPMTINALAAELVMDRTTLGRNILPLERDGLITVEPMASDRRSKELHLTKAGERRLEAARPGWLKAQARFESTFGSNRTSELRELLHAVVASELSPPSRD